MEILAKFYPFYPIPFSVWAPIVAIIVVLTALVAWAVYRLGTRK